MSIILASQALHHHHKWQRPKHHTFAFFASIFANHGLIKMARPDEPFGRALRNLLNAALSSENC